jgi:hypothetical protein
MADVTSVCFKILQFSNKTLLFFYIEIPPNILMKYFTTHSHSEVDTLDQNFINS